MDDARSLYDEDFIAWSRQQATALRAAARSGSNLPLDWENLAEEVDSLGLSERRVLHSQIQRVICHLLKLEHSPAVEPRRGWIETVNDARSELELVLEMSPSLKNEVGAVIRAELPRGSRRAVQDLERYGKGDRTVLSKIRASRYTEDQILGNWFPAALQRSASRGKRAR